MYDESPSAEGSVERAPSPVRLRAASRHENGGGLYREFQMVSIRTVLGSLTFVLFAYACSDSSDPGARVVSGLESAQCDVKLFRVDSETCLTSFTTCRAKNDLATCRDAYVACLPVFPSNTGSGGGGQSGRGNVERRDRNGGDNVSIASASLSACASARTACITQTSDPSGCGATAAECVRRAFHDAFVSTCANAKTRCDDGDYTETSCATITTRCTQGEAPATVPDSQCPSPAQAAPQPVPTDSGSTTDATTTDATTPVDATVPVDSSVPPDAGASDASSDAPADG
jgi:hypothetical protein